MQNIILLHQELVINKKEDGGREMTSKVMCVSKLYVGKAV